MNSPQSMITQIPDNDLQIQSPDSSFQNTNAHNQFVQIQQPAPSQHQSSYRPDIDGLRTIAITVVVIFHAFPQFMTGGFIGVDVFFVISGYLISGIIIKQAKKDKFSYTDFYSRRIKRIYPALLLVLFFVLVLAIKVYERKQIVVATKTMAAATVFSANIEILSYEKGYFDPDVKQNPLLHLWSLGVEEQFYIVWPCFITFLFSRAKSSATLLLSLFTLFSFVLGLVIVFSNPKFAFYFPVCRFWQMSIGGLIAHLGAFFDNQQFNNILSIFGTASIMFIVWVIDQRSLFPGWWALLPTLGSACVIQAGPEALVNKYILSSELFVFIGKISYPLYLWHWPLLVFSRYMYPRGSDSIFANTYFILFICVALSTITYYFVENKIRFRKQNIVVVLLLLLMVSIGTYSIFIINSPQQKIPTQIQILQISDSDYGLVRYFKQYQKAMIPGPDDFYVKNGKKLPNSSKNQKRLPTSVEKLKASRKFSEWDESVPRKFLEKKVEEKSRYFQSNRPNLTVFEVANQGKDNQVFIIGDSHAKFLVWRFQFLFEQAVRQKRIQKFPTVLAVIKENAPYIHYNQEWVDYAQSMVKKHRPKRVLFAHRWLGYWRDCYQCTQGMSAFSEQHYSMLKSHVQQYASLMEQLVKAGIQVNVVTIHLDYWQLDPRNMYDANGIIEKNIEPLKLSWFREAYKRAIDIFESNMQRVGAKLVHLSDNHCWEDICHLLSPTGYSFFIDDNHYGKLYSRYWASSVDFMVDF